MMDMPDFIPNRFKVRNEVCAVEVDFREDGTCLESIFIKRRGSRIEITDTRSENELKNFSTEITKRKLPVVIVFNGKGIIHKRFSTTDDAMDTNHIVRQSMPGVNIEDFYVQLYFQGKTAGFISFCRKEQLNSFVENAQSQIHLAMVLIGPPAVLGLSSLLSSQDKLYTSHHVITIDQNLVQSIIPLKENLPESQQIGNIDVSAKTTLAFAGGLSYLMQNVLVTNISSEFDNIWQRHLECNKFRVMLVAAVFSILAIAIFNGAAFSFYFKKDQETAAELAVYQDKYDRIEELSAKFERHKQFIEVTSNATGQKLSEYADRVAASVPTEVTLTELNFNPGRIERTYLDSVPRFHDRKLVIKGNCNKSFIINNWLSTLKAETFVQNAVLKQFTFKSNEFIPNFEIELQTK